MQLNYKGAPMSSRQVRFPGESDEYREAREALLEAELELRRHIEAVAAQRRALPLGGVKPGEEGLPLGVPCPICTSIIDGIDGAVRHLDQLVNVAVVAKAPVETLAAHARARGWRRVRLLSSAGTTFNRDYNAETEDEEQFAMATVFVRRDGRIHHFWSSELWYARPEAGQHPRHVDFMWPMWAILDRTPQGRGSGWMPQLEYD